jgi:retron-type reverse transcriptase
MNQFDLKSKFTEEFFKEYQFDAEFRNIFENLCRGFSPYAAIEYLCKSKKELLVSLQNALENTPRKIIVSTETLEKLKDECS